jgi:hypothetical protein
MCGNVFIIQTIFRFDIYRIVGVICNLERVLLLHINRIMYFQMKHLF